MEDMEKEFLITYFKHLAEEIRFSKRQQMMATWYLLLLYGVIAKTYKDWFGFTKWLPIIISILLFGMGYFFICSCKRSQCKNNKWVIDIRKKFKLCDKIIGNQNDIPCRPDMVTFLYYVIHSFACGITILIIFN